MIWVKYILLTYWAIQGGNKTIRSYNRLELQGMYPFVAIVDISLIFEWVANRADSAMNKTPVVESLPGAASCFRTASRFCALCLRMITSCHDCNLKLF